MYFNLLYNLVDVFIHHTGFFFLHLIRLGPSDATTEMKTLQLLVLAEKIFTVFIMEVLCRAVRVFTRNLIEAVLMSSSVNKFIRACYELCHVLRNAPK